MIEVHHLNASRSRRITWLLEELGVDYQLVTYKRDATTNLAPPELKKVHPLGKAPVIRDNAPLQPRIESEMQNHLGFLNNELNGRNYFVGNDLTGADVNLSFVAQVAVTFGGREAYPNLTQFVDRIEARPAYKRAIEKAGA